MSFLLLVGIFLASSLLAVLLAPKPDPGDGPGDFRPPEPREGEPIPVAFGTVKISPSVVWFGDVQANRVTKRESAFFGLISQDVPLGYEYLAGMQLVLCHGKIDSILDIHIGDYHVVRKAQPRVAGTVPDVPITTPWRNTDPGLPVDAPLPPIDAGPIQVNLNLPDLFGGFEEGGGIQGLMDVYFGTTNQGQNDYLALRWGDPSILPQYPEIAYVVLRRMNLGKSPNPLPWQFVVKRIPRLLGQNAYSEITDEDGNACANVGEVLWELLTNQRWGVGANPEELILEDFQQVAQTLHTEGRGVSGQLISRSQVWQAARNVLSHVDGLLYQHPLDGRVGVMLIREDYDPDTLPVFDESNSVLEESRTGSWAEIVNETNVTFTDVARRFSAGSASAQNLAAIESLGRIRSQKIDLPWFTTHEQAQWAASRDNQRTSVPIKRGRLVTTRLAYTLHQGSPFRIDYPDRALPDVICRVTSIDYGSLTENRCVIEWASENLYRNPYGSPGAYTDPEYCGPLALLLPGYDPADDSNALYGEGEVVVFEAPYWHVGAVRRAWAAVSRTTNQEVYWLPYRADHGESEYRRVEQPTAFQVVGILEDDLAVDTAATGVTFTVRNIGQLEFLTSTDAAGRLAGDRLAMIFNGSDDVAEIVAWETVTDNDDGTYEIGGVWRGQLDTVPQGHPESSRVVFYWNSDITPQNARDISSGNYDDGDWVGMRPSRVDITGAESDPQFAEADSVVLGDRSTAPYPPGDVELNSNPYSTWPTSTSGDVTLSWAHRSRVNQTEMVAQDDATSGTLEGTLTVQVLLDGQQVREFTGLTGTSQVYTYAQRTSDSADATKKVQFRIVPVGAGGEIGTVRVTPAFTMGA